MFSNVAFSVLAFLLALGILISIHEFGHFWVARKVGVKVLRFSIGFGKPLWSRTGKIDNTEFVVAAIPLGGYVKMLDEREAPVDDAELSRAFNRQPLWARAAVVVAGPVANFLLAFVAYWIVMIMGISGVAPLIGPTTPDSLAARAGFQAEDQLLSVNGSSTPSWTEARIALLDASLDTSKPVIVGVRTLAGTEQLRTLDLDNRKLLKEDGDPIENLGFTPWFPVLEPVIGDVLEDTVAEQAGLQASDRIVDVDGKAIASWQEFVAVIQPSADKAVEITLLRDGMQRTVTLTPAAFDYNGRVIGRIGVSESQSAELYSKARVTVKYPPLQSVGKALTRTWDMSLLTLRMLGKLVVGEASLQNISGPISIAQFAGQSASVGLDHYINFIAMISISLAVLNLLPIPMLDGGHLFFFACEAITRRPVSEQIQILGQQVGIVLLGGLMFLAFYNDFWRLIQ